MIPVVFASNATTIAALLKETTPTDVKTFIDLSHLSADKVIEKSELPKLLGVAPTPSAAAATSASTAQQQLHHASSAPSGVTLSLPKKSTAAISVPAVAAAPPPVAHVAAAPKAKKFASPPPKASAASLAAAENMYDDGDYNDPDYLDAPTPKAAKRSSIGGTANIADQYQYGEAYGQEGAVLESGREKLAWELAAEEVWKNIRR